MGLTMTRRLLAVAAAALLTLTACSGLNPTPSGTVAGTCLADYNGPDADRTSIVDCSQEHTFDVYASATWPGMDAAIADSDAEAVFDALTSDAASVVSDVYWAWAHAECSDRFIEHVGLDSVTIEGKSAQELGLLPGGRWDLDYSLDAREAFVGGDHSTICSLVWYDEAGDPATVKHEPGVSAATMLSNFTTELQGCFTRDPDADPRYSNTNCAEPHNGQYLMYLDALAALGADFVSSMDPETTIFADYEPLDSYCTTVIETVYPGVLDSPSWTVWSDQTGRFAGWQDYNGTVDADQIYPVYCAILAPVGELRGDVISGNATVSLEIG